MSLKKRSLVMMAAIMLPRCLWAQFTDVPQSHWAHDAVQKISEAGILSGKVDGQFQGSKAATRYDLAVALAKMLAEVENAWIAQGQSPDDLVPYIEQINLYVADEIDRLKQGQRELTAWMNEIRARLDRMEDQMANADHKVVAVREKCDDSGDCHSHDKGQKKAKKKSHEDHKAVQTTMAEPKKRSTKKKSIARAEKSRGVLGWIESIFEDDDDERKVARVPVKKRSFQKAPVAQAESAQLASPPVVESKVAVEEPEVEAAPVEPVKIADAPKKRSQAPVRSKARKRAPIKRSTTPAAADDPAPIFKNSSTKSKVESPVAVKPVVEPVARVVKPEDEEDGEAEEVDSEEESVTPQKKTISLSEKSRAILQSYRERKKK